MRWSSLAAGALALLAPALAANEIRPWWMPDPERGPVQAQPLETQASGEALALVVIAVALAIVAVVLLRRQSTVRPRRMLRARGWYRHEA